MRGAGLMKKESTLLSDYILEVFLI
jgi:hypothetical protein